MSTIRLTHAKPINIRRDLSRATKQLRQTAAASNLKFHSQPIRIQVRTYSSNHRRRFVNTQTNALTVKENDDGSADLLTFGKGPKEYTDSKFIVIVNDYFGPFVGYEWGSLPPVYKFVDHKWPFGVLFKSKILTT